VVLAISTQMQSKVFYLLVCQVAKFGHDCRTVADTKYNIAELLELYISEDEGHAGKSFDSSGKHDGGKPLVGKSRARTLYLEAKQV